MLTLLNFVLFLLLGHAHPLHISMSTIEFSEKGKAELVVKLFSDDFENAIHLHSKKRAGLTQENISENAIEYASAYITSKLKVEVDNKPLTFEPDRIERNHEATWVYFIAKSPKQGRIKIVNLLMNKMFSDQRNLMIITYGGKQKTVSFDNRQTGINFEFSDF